MAIKRVDTTYVENGTTNYVGKIQLQCLTTEIKPTLIPEQSGSTCVTFDPATKLMDSVYIWHDNEWFEC